MSSPGVPGTDTGTSEAGYQAEPGWKRVYRVALVVLIVALLGGTLYYIATTSGPGGSATSSSTSSSSTSSVTSSSSSPTTSSSSSGPGPQGVVTGYVTVGPSQSSCSSNQSCTEDLSGYSLIFTSQCPTESAAAYSATCQPQTYEASIAPSGHYSILLTPGPYSIMGLAPSCTWVGCSSAFPVLVTVEAGQQLVVNVDVDTGIS